MFIAEFDIATSAGDSCIKFLFECVCVVGFFFLASASLPVSVSPLYNSKIQSLVHCLATENV